MREVIDSAILNEGYPGVFDAVNSSVWYILEVATYHNPGILP